MKATLWVFLALSFVAGFADTATFIHLAGLFSSHVTGNFVLLAASLQKNLGEGGFLKLFSLPVFAVGVFAATLIHDRLRGNKAEDGLDRHLAVAAGALLFFAGILALFFGRHGGSGAHFTSADVAAGIITITAMGIQNAIHRFAAPLGPPTTVMTVNVTQLAVMASRRIARGKEQTGKPPAPPFSLASLAWLALAFAAGCALSALLTLTWGLVSLTVPGVLLISMAFAERTG